MSDLVENPEDRFSHVMAHIHLQCIHPSKLWQLSWNSWSLCLPHWGTRTVVGYGIYDLLSSRGQSLAYPHIARSENEVCHDIICFYLTAKSRHTLAA